jgi:hypothetical protein
MARLGVCGRCNQHVKGGDVQCPHCGDVLRAGAPTAAALLLGFALSGCTSTEKPPTPDPSPVKADPPAKQTKEPRPPPEPPDPIPVEEPAYGGPELFDPPPPDPEQQPAYGEPGPEPPDDPPEP